MRRHNLANSGFHSKWHTGVGVTATTSGLPPDAYFASLRRPRPSLPALVNGNGLGRVRGSRSKRRNIMWESSSSATTNINGAPMKDCVLGEANGHDHAKCTQH